MSINETSYIESHYISNVIIRTFKAKHFGSICLLHSKKFENINFSMFVLKFHDIIS